VARAGPVASAPGEAPGRLRTLILCGGRGTRAYPQTVEVPKPLLEVAGKPVLWHLMGIYAAQGFTDFVLAAGYKADLLAAFAGTLPAAWNVEVIDTGVSMKSSSSANATISANRASISALVRPRSMPLT